MQRAGDQDLQSDEKNICNTLRQSHEHHEIVGIYEKKTDQKTDYREINDGPRQASLLSLVLLIQRKNRKELDSIDEIFHHLTDLSSPALRVVT
jgi:hypothetical protein